MGCDKSHTVTTVQCESQCGMTVEHLEQWPMRLHPRFAQAGCRGTCSYRDCMRAMYWGILTSMHAPKRAAVKSLC